MMELTLDDLLAAADIAGAPPAPASAPVPWSMYAAGEDQDELRRTEVQARALGRIRGWTGMDGYELWRRLVDRFEGNEELAREPALRTCERMVRDRGPASQQRPHPSKRLLLGWHARGRLDERYAQRGLEGVWWARRDEAIDEFEYAELPLPFKGLMRVLKYIVWSRARIRPCDL